MQIIQSIRDKGSVIMVVLIVLCLIGFILMDSNKGSGGSMFSSDKTSIGKIDGEKVEINYFNQRVTQLEEQEAQRSGQRPTGERTYQLRDQMWNQIVAEKIFLKEADKLGISFTAKELSAILLSNDQNNPFLQQQGMVDPATGQLDMAKAQEALSNIKKFKGEQRNQVNAQIVEPLQLSSIVAKYSGLISASAYYPEWMVQKDVAESNDFATVSYVAVPYNEISDSSIKVTDADINAYVAKHKELFKQEDGRQISYISFSQLPSAADSIAQRKILEDLKVEFAADTNTKAFVARNASLVDYDDTYLPKSKIPTSAIDTIINNGAGNVYGPYHDQNAFILAKYIGSKQLPDSVKARHILIAEKDPQSGAVIRDDAAAKSLADSILAAIKAGADFGALAAKYSSDGSAATGGDLGTFGYGQMVPEFNDFSFNKAVGSMDVVKTQFGYHIINIINQKDFKPAYKIAFIAREITPSDATINDASLAATKASAQKNSKELSDYAAKNGLSLIQVPTTLQKNDYAIGNIRDARPVVKWAFESKQGDVSEPFNVGNQFLIATVNKIDKEGVQDAATARSGAEVIIRNEKKAEMIKSKLGKNPTLEAAAAAYNKQVLMVGADSTLTMAAQIVAGLGVEPKLQGAAFNKENLNKVSAPFAGTSGVYVIKTLSVAPKNTVTPEMMAQQASNRLISIRSQLSNWYEGLKSKVEVKDNRSNIF